jgi:hypothetical protein
MKPQVDLSVKTTKIIAIGRLTEKAKTAANFVDVMLREVPATVSLYLDSKIEYWYAKTDKNGVVFILNATSIEEAHALLDPLPLGVEGLMEFDMIPVGPLSPLRFLL